ncbi:MAG: hypothetical protein ACR2OL_11490 [Anderseniella sp.]
MWTNVVVLPEPQVDAVCANCERPMDITALRKRLGDDFPTCDLAGRLRCTSCSGRKVLTIISPNKTGPGR